MSDDFASAKLRDFVRGRVNDNEDLYYHTGVVPPGTDSSDLLSFMESVYDADDDLPRRLKDTVAARDLRNQAATDHVGEHVDNIPAYAVGVTEKDVSMQSHHAFSKLQKSLHNNGAPYIGVMFGSPNSGKTNFALTYIQLWRELVELKYNHDSPVILSNLESFTPADHYVPDYETLRNLLFGDETYFETGGAKGTPPTIEPETPCFWLFDECSTHLDARTHRHPVATYYTPLLKRFAKVNVDAMHIGHSGLDIHPELRRHTISTEFIFKRDLTDADIYAKMDDDEGKDKKYHLQEIPETDLHYSPDDFSPWAWPD